MQTIVAVPPDTQGYEELIERAMEKQKAHVNSVFERSRVDNEKAEREPTVEALQSSIEALKSQLSVTSLFGIKNEAATEAEGCVTCHRLVRPARQRRWPRAVYFGGKRRLRRGAVCVRVQSVAHSDLLRPTQNCLHRGR